MGTLTDSTLTRDYSIENKSKSGSEHDRPILLGYILLIISTVFYGLEEYYDLAGREDNFTIFFVHFFIALTFVIILIVNKSYGIRRSWQRENIHKTVILLNLFLVSAYALNRQLPVFEDSVDWFCYYLILSSAVTLSYRYFDRLPKVVNYVQSILLGSACVLYLYLMIYVANFYMVGAIGILFFGVGAHIFVPLLLLFAALRLLMITHEKTRVSIIWVVAGALLSIGVVAGFIAEWNTRIKAIDRLANQSVIHADTELPIWMKVAQTVKNDWITERILKSRFVYTVSNNHFQWDFFPSGRNWDEKRKHDPLVFIASANNISSISEEDRKNILKAITDSRHKAQERLWSGDNLTTSYIVSDVDIYPELRIAYTEHYLNIRNTAVNDRWWGNSEEAIYTFQLPEGSIVTSLSLWINGKEEKAILTSKQKATEAYTSIVGRERRDPSVVHWQEGNTISVRVFPCTPQEERKFKIGITSPLAVIDNKVIYKNVTFRGPNANGATQTSRIRFIGSANNIDIPANFTKNIKGEFFSEGEYDADLTISMALTPIKENHFSFDGFSYQLAETSPSSSKVTFKTIYLDLNNAWTADEIESIRQITQRYQVFAYIENDFVSISPDNWAEVTAQLHQANFSLFPFHHIKNTSNAIVVTKGKELSPYLRDVKASEFAIGIANSFASGNKVYVFNLEGGTSTFIRSLKELRAFHFTQGNADEFLEILETSTFPEVTESDQQVVLSESHMVVQKKPLMNENTNNNAPDHLARLFAYNDIMRQVGVNFFKEDFINENLVDEAASAYVVSPVSSLIVLETKEDYERFGIKDKDNSLHNASKDSSGAVPEPHEWAMIVLFLGLIAFYVVRNSRSKLHPGIK